MTAYEIACRNFWRGDIYALDRYNAEVAARNAEIAARNAADMAAEYDLTFDEIVALLNA